MSKGNGPLLPLASPGYRDPGDSIFSINTEEWLDHPPPLPGVGEDTVKSPNPRPFFLDRYRQSADPAEWNHYVLLGFFFFTDGQAFESQWKNDPDDWLTCHKIVWYNYIYHLDYQLTASPKLHIWASQLSQSYLQQFDPQPPDHRHSASVHPWIPKWIQKQNDRQSVRKSHRKKSNT
jgi:hypothetical protein